MNKFSNDKRYVLVNTGLHFFTWTMLFVLFWDFGAIDLYDAIVHSLIAHD